jgi:hypothetical protein
MQDLNIAVLGHRRTGKSTFIRRALNLPDVGAGAVCTRKMTIDGGYYIVRFLEMALNEVHVGEQNTIRWPQMSDDLGTPRIDGAVTIYDVTSQESLKGVPDMLS